MITSSHPYMNARNHSLTPAGIIAGLLALALATGLQAASITKAATGTDLTAGASWGGTSPGSGDVATWAGTSLGTGLTLASSRSWSGISVASAASAIDVTGAGVLTLGSGGIDMSAAAVDLTLGTPIALGANQTWAASSGRTLAAAGIISGPSMVLTKNGSGMVKIHGLTPNTYSGGTIVNGGTLWVGTMTGSTSPLCTGVLGTGPVTLNSGTITFDRVTAANALTVNGGTLYSQNGWGVTWSGAITMNAALTCNTGYGMTCSGAISGVGGLNKTGGDILKLSGTNSYAGPTTVTGGTLQCDLTASLGGGALSIGTGAKVNLNHAGTKTVATLTLGGVAKTVAGTYGSVASGAAFPNDTYFAGAGTVTLLPLITSFGIPGYAGVINQAAKTISLTVPFGTSLATLAPTFTVTFGSCNQTSGSPPSPTFAAGNPVHYIVTSGSYQTDYAVSVTVAPVSTACDILTFGLPNNAGFIDQVAKTITLTVPISPGVSSLSPTYTLSPSATCSPPSNTTLNFTNPQTYTVTAQDGITQKSYTVKAQTYLAWTYSGSLFILTTPDGANIPAGASETNFPLLVRLNKDWFDFSQAKAGGDDLRFATVTGVPLPYQIEQWDAVAGTAAIWVRIPAITGNARQEIKMYWGKSDAASDSNGPAVFNATNGYCSVMHLNGNVLDATGSTSPVNGGATPTPAVIGSTAMNLGSGDISATNITNFPTGSNPASSSEIWIRARQINSWSMPLAWGNQNAYGWNTWNMQIGFWGSPPVLPSPLTCRGPAAVSGSTALAAQQWYHVVYTSSNGTGKIYINGVLDATASGGTISITNPQAMSLGAGGVDADVDEARISSVARSANWVKMAYENQKPLQTLLGNVVQAGSTFSATPPSVTMDEGTTTTLTGQAGGAQKVYWSLVRNGVETVLATDQFTYTVSAGRVTGNQSFVIRFKGIYPAPATNQTVDIPVTVTDTIPDPVFTLSASTSVWDGRQTMTVTPVISNLAALQAAGVANLNYQWSVAGVAVAKQITAGTPTVPGVMTLTRAQGSGPLTVTLVLDNGGALVSNSNTVTVQEPASDAWLQRTPGATEKPVNKQFFARDPNTNNGTIYYNGTQSGSPDTVYLKIYTTDAGDVLYSTLRQTPGTGGTYAFTAPIDAGKVTYKVVYGTTAGGVDTPVGSPVTNLVCGDAYLIDGQSNALATDNSAPNDSTTDPWIRTYGLTLGWGSAISKGSEMQLGLWGWYLAKSMTATYNMPVCFIQGAVGGTRIDQHQPNPADHAVAGSLYSIYANIYKRVVGAKLTHGIRGVFWHQGESNSGADSPTGDYDYKSYQQYFIDMSMAWKQDFPNIQRYIIWQVMPKPCSMGPKGDQLREVLRTLPRLYSKMNILDTLGMAGYEGCHFSPTGYQNFANRTAPLVGQDFYGIVPPASVTAPNLKRACFTTSARTAITLEFDQDMGWNSFSKANFYLNKVGGKVSSGAVDAVNKKLVTLQLSSAAAATATLDYLEDNFWNSGESVSSLLYGANAIPALTFADVPIEPASQTITFGALPTKTYGNTPFALTATATSGLTVSYVSSDPTVASISGATVTIWKAGSTTITASQAGDASYSAATPVAQLLTVNNAATTTTLSTSGTPSIYGVPVTLTATVAPTIGGGTVQFHDNTVALGSPVALGSGQAQLVTSAFVTGSHSITATYSGTTNYNGSSATAMTQTVNKAPPEIITPPTASDIVYGQTLASSVLSGGVGSVAGSFDFTTPSTTPAVGTASHSVTFTPSDTANYQTATTSVSVTVTGSSYLSWATDPAQGLTAGVNDGPNDDPDHDGIANLLEFTLGGVPMASGQEILPKLTKSTGGVWEFEYDRSDLSLAPATTQAVEYGDDLTGWTAVPVPATSNAVVTITPGSPSDHVKVSIPNPGSQLFVRLKVTQSP